MRQLGDLIESIHIMQYTCSVLLILQAMSFLRVAKGYARLGPSPFWLFTQAFASLRLSVSQGS